MSEQWLPVVGYEGWYDVSNWGRVMRKKEYRTTFAGKILKPSLDSWGYPSVSLYRNGKKHPAKVHRLVMAAFIGPCPECKQVNHIDGDKTNNHFDNLEYVTGSGNMSHAYAMGLKSNRGENHSCNKLKEADIPKIRRLLRDGFTQVAIGIIFNVSQSNISCVATGKTWGWLKEETADTLEQLVVK